MHIKMADTRLLHRGSEIVCNAPLFIAGDGETIYEGDCISVYPDNEIFPYQGTVTADNGLIQVRCYRQKWEKWIDYNLVK